MNSVYSHRVLDPSESPNDPIRLICFYLSTEMNKLPDIHSPSDLHMNDDSRLVGYLYGFMDPSNYAFTLNYIEIKKTYRKNKWSIYLIYTVLDFIMLSDSSIIWVELDDMSDFSNDEKYIERNMYFRLGFCIQDEHNRWIQWAPKLPIHGPERRGHIKTIVKNALDILG